MLTHTTRWSHPPGNAVVPSPWQATPDRRAKGGRVSPVALSSRRVVRRRVDTRVFPWIGRRLLRSDVRCGRIAGIA